MKLLFGHRINKKSWEKTKKSPNVRMMKGDIKRIQEVADNMFPANSVQGYYP